MKKRLLLTLGLTAAITTAANAAVDAAVTTLITDVTSVWDDYKGFVIAAVGFSIVIAWVARLRSKRG